MESQQEITKDFLQNPQIYYLDNLENISIEGQPSINVEDVVFVKVKRITFDDKAPRKEAIENVLSTLRFPGVNIVYLIKGTKRSVSFYYGIVNNKIRPIGNMFNISSIGDRILKRCIEGNFRGSEVDNVSKTEAADIINYLKTSKHLCNICGIPGINNEESANFQGVDRLIDTMLGDDFMFVVTALNLSHGIISSIENNVCGFYDSLVPFSKQSHQEGTSTNTSSSETLTTNDSVATSESKSTQKGTTLGKSTGKTVTSKNNSGNSENGTESSSTQQSSTTGVSQSTTVGKGKSVANSNANSKSKNFSYENTNKQAQSWMNYADETTLAKLDYGKGKGLYIVCMTLFSNDLLTLQKLENTTTSLYSGEKGNRVPLRKAILKSNTECQLEFHLRNMQIPIGHFIREITNSEVLTRTVLAQYATNKKLYLGNWMSVRELGIIAGLPQKEVVGLALREEVEFGLNYDEKSISESNKIRLGYLVHSGRVNMDIPVSLSKKSLDKHIFICGVTGCGKTTTCMGLLQKSGMPFLVIEPAKTEYRILTSTDEDMIVFTLGRDDIAPFRFNPLEFLPSETISSHVDMVKASIEAAFNMEAAIPQIIESALYKCYEDYGWNVINNKNDRFSRPFDDGVYAFPTLGDLLRNVEIVVDSQGFDERLKNDYIGSIRARLQGLLLGAKGAMLNTPRSIDFTDIVHKKVILELEEIKSGTEKSLIMGFILSTLCEAIKYEYSKNSQFKHLTLVEEAHRLLSRYIPGDSLSKKNGVETFSDMLAEVRKYGEGLIIADQIPEKMAPDVLKNTNTKIVHKIFAQDDKDAIGNTISLTNEQKAYLSTLSAGRAVVFSQDWEKSIQVQIERVADTSCVFADLDRIRNKSLEYYLQGYKRGVYPELLCCRNQPSLRQFTGILNKLHRYKECKRLFSMVLYSMKETDTRMLATVMQELLTIHSTEEIAKYLSLSCIKKATDEDTQLVEQLLVSIQNGLSNLNTPDLQVTYETIFKPNKIIKYDSLIY